MLIVGTLSLIGMGAALDLGYGGLPGQRTPRTGDFKFRMENVWLSVLLLVGGFKFVRGEVISSAVIFFVLALQDSSV